MSATMMNPIGQAARVGALEETGAATTPGTPEARVLASGLEGAQSAAAPAPPQTEPPRKYWDRNENGRFLPGNRGGTGNPHAREVARLRERLILKLSDADLDEIQMYADRYVAYRLDYM